jgi:hypothetical protein
LIKGGNQKENEKKSKRLDVGSTSVPTTVGLDLQEKTKVPVPGTLYLVLVPVPVTHCVPGNAAIRHIETFLVVSILRKTFMNSS